MDDKNTTTIKQPPKTYRWMDSSTMRVHNFPNEDMRDKAQSEFENDYKKTEYKNQLRAVRLKNIEKYKQYAEPEATDAIANTKSSTADEGGGVAKINPKKKFIKDIQYKPKQ